MAMFKQVADIKTADMLNLPVPEVEYHNIAVKPSQVQKEMVASLGERAEKIRGGNVDSSVDNMLKVTNDGRKLALDQRMMNPMLPDEEGSKVNACVNEVFRIWEENSDKRLTQLLFCDLSTPKGAGEFSVYTDIRKKLIERGIPESEIKFIHEADTETKKQELFKKVRRGEVRILMGSTQKMGAGTNVQNKIIASHDLDCPWRPADLEQRAGRTVRQGNDNPKVGLYRYVTEGTFDAYCWQHRIQSECTSVSAKYVRTASLRQQRYIQSAIQSADVRTVPPKENKGRNSCVDYRSLFASYNRFYRHDGVRIFG